METLLNRLEALSVQVDQIKDCYDWAQNELGVGDCTCQIDRIDPGSVCEGACVNIVDYPETVEDYYTDMIADLTDDEIRVSVAKTINSDGEVGLLCCFIISDQLTVNSVSFVLYKDGYTDNKEIVALREGVKA